MFAYKGLSIKRTNWNLNAKPTGKSGRACVKIQNWTHPGGPVFGTLVMETHFLFASHTLISKIIPDRRRHQRQPVETGGSDCSNREGFSKVSP